MKIIFVLFLCYSTTLSLKLFKNLECSDADTYCCNDHKAFPIEIRCNGVIECVDGEDEVDCQCDDKFRCTNGACINLDQVCDGISNCNENEDELDCAIMRIVDEIPITTSEIVDATTTTEYTKGKFQCQDGMYVFRRWLCDGEFDCSDGEDESPFLCENMICQSDEFKCGIPKGRCISKKFVCDGDRDCFDGSDEVNCNNTCRSDQFTCTNGHCIAASSRCDTINDCDDGSDELNCTITEVCNENEFMCANGKCILQRWRCDNEFDCADSSDELNCDQMNNLKENITSTEQISTLSTTEEVAQQNSTEISNPLDFTTENDDFHGFKPFDTKVITEAEPEVSTKASTEAEAEVSTKVESIIKSIEQNSTPLFELTTEALITKPLSVKLSKDYYIIVQNSDFSLTCGVSGYTFPSFTWKKLYENSLGSNVQQIGNILNIVHAQPENRGIYQCIAELNGQFDEVTAAINVELREAPQIEIYPSEPQILQVGDYIVLKCRAIAGSPAPTLEWVRRDRALLSHRIEEMSIGTILISNITAAEAGDYECRASNIVGEASKMTSIIVQQPQSLNITILPNLPEITLNEGNQLYLLCSTDGSSPATVQWYGPKSQRKLGLLTQLPNSTATNYAIFQKNNVSRTDEGIYVCHASNNDGQNKKHIKILIQQELNNDYQIDDDLVAQPIFLVDD